MFARSALVTELFPPPEQSTSSAQEVERPLGLVLVVRRAKVTPDPRVEATGPGIAKGEGTQGDWQ
jgi:hypothetical protein